MKDGSGNVMILQTRCPTLTKSFFATKATLQFTSDEEFVSFLLETAKPVISYVTNRKTSHDDHDTGSLVNGESNGLNGHISSDNGLNGHISSDNGLNGHISSDTQSDRCEAEESLREQKSGDDLSPVSISETKENDRLVQHAGCNSTSTPTVSLSNTSVGTQTVNSAVSPLRNARISGSRDRVFFLSPGKRKQGALQRDDTKKAKTTAKVIEVVVKKEADADEGARLFHQVNLACGRCSLTEEETVDQYTSTRDSKTKHVDEANASKEVDPVPDILQSPGTRVMQNSCGRENNNITKVDLVKISKSRASMKFSHYCNICKRCFRSVRRYRAHKRWHTRISEMAEPDDNDFIEEELAEEEPTSDNLASDIAKTMQSSILFQPDLNVSVRPDEQANKENESSVSEKQEIERSCIELHARTSTTLQCPSCTYCSPEAEAVWEHINTSCTPSRTPKSCCFCPFKPASRRGLMLHIRRHHCILQCDICLVNLKAAEITDHYETHTKDKKVGGNKCFACDYVSSKRGDSVLRHGHNAHFKSTGKLVTRYEVAKKSAPSNNQDRENSSLQDRSTIVVCSTETVNENHMDNDSVPPVYTKINDDASTCSSTTYKCPCCKYDHPDAKILWEHIKSSCTFRRLKLKKCCFCPQRMNGHIGHLRQHINYCHCFLQCELCDKLVEAPDITNQFDTHRKGDNTNCCVCDHSYPHKRAGLSHVRLMHFKSTGMLLESSIVSSLQCDECGEKFDILSRLLHHKKRTHTNENMLIPAIQSPDKVESLDTHAHVNMEVANGKSLASSSSVSPWTCLWCEKRYIYSACAVKHIKTIHADKALDEKAKTYCAKLLGISRLETQRSSRVRYKGRVTNYGNC